MRKIIVKYYETSHIFDGMLLCWLKPVEIHINKKWENTPIADLIIKHELMHLKFIKKMRKIEKNKKINRFLKPILVTLTILGNNFWDQLDCEKLDWQKLFYELSQKKD